MEVDEDAAAQQPVDLVLAGRVAAHQALDGSGLVGAVVVDMEASEVGSAACPSAP